MSAALNATGRRGLLGLVAAVGTVSALPAPLLAGTGGGAIRPFRFDVAEAALVTCANASPTRAGRTARPSGISLRACSSPR